MSLKYSAAKALAANFRRGGGIFKGGRFGDVAMQSPELNCPKPMNAHETFGPLMLPQLFPLGWGELLQLWLEGPEHRRNVWTGGRTYAARGQTRSGNPKAT
jgi:hypothetical protein